MKERNHELDEIKKFSNIMCNIFISTFIKFLTPQKFCLLNPLCICIKKIVIARTIFFYFRTYQCLRHNAELNLEKLRDLQCIDDNDCGTDISQMICTNYTRSSLTKYCSCPPGYAYNTNECKCMPAEICCTNSVSNYLIIIIVPEFLYSISGIMCK